MAQLNEQLLDPAIALVRQGGAAAAEPHQIYALKHADFIVVANAHGDIHGVGDGLFSNDTRVISRFVLTIDNQVPMLLGSALSHDNIVFTADCGNPPLTLPDGELVLQSVVHIERSRVVWSDRLYERITFTSYRDQPLTLPVSIGFAADFFDMFEVRGSTRRSRGLPREAEVQSDRVTLRYEGLDHVLRESTLAFSRPPDRLVPGRAEFAITLPSLGRQEFYLEIGVTFSDETPSVARFRQARGMARAEMRKKSRYGASVRSSGRVFNEWLSRSRSDSAMLATELATGPYPYAGIPWYSTIFGRDGIISALQMVWLNPTLARGVLAYLALNQATETAAFRDAQPGKILHETRKGEMASLAELPFGRYYGGVDTTPLFVYLASVYADRTGDIEFIDSIWPSLCAAAAWMEWAAAENPDGFVIYQRAAESGLSNQGWKDSFDSVRHADGSFPVGPIALVEVQGYVYAAYKGLANLAERRGETETSEHWHARAEAMRLRVESRFWMEDLGFYALAIDGDGRPCRVRSSNPGHLLFVGLPTEERARLVSEQFLSTSFYTGWGIRTLADAETAYNPMSYHNGSVWPHDTALCAVGLSRYGVRDGVVRLMSDMFETAIRFNMRLPELFCGFPRRMGRGPVAYPVACMPQAWSAGAVYMMLQACLGIEIDGWKREIRLMKPRLPIGIDRITIHRLALGDCSMDLSIQRSATGIVAQGMGPDADRVPIMVRT